MSAATLTRLRPRTVVITDDGDHDRFTHIVGRQANGLGGEAAVWQASIDGTTVTALCGKTWVPHRDPNRYDVCPTCEDEWAIRVGVVAA